RQLAEVELLAIPREVTRRPHVRRVERPYPVAVVVAAGADPDHKNLRNARGEGPDRRPGPLPRSVFSNSLCRIEYSESKAKVKPKNPRIEHVQRRPLPSSSRLCGPGSRSDRMMLTMLMMMAPRKAAGNPLTMKATPNIFANEPASRSMQALTMNVKSPRLTLTRGPQRT